MVVNIMATVTLGSSCDYARHGNNAGRFFYWELPQIHEDKHEQEAEPKATKISLPFLGDRCTRI
jgi:hypothetical protein